MFVMFQCLLVRLLDVVCLQGMNFDIVSFFFMFLTFVVVCFVLVMIQMGLCPIPLFKKTG